MKKYYLLLLTILNLSCIQEIEINPDTDESSITSFFSLITIGKNNKIRVVNTKRINDLIDVNNGHLKLIVSSKNNLSVPFEWFENGNYFVNDTFIFAPNEMYDIKLYNDSNLIAHAKDYIPSSPFVSDAYVSYIIANDGNDRVIFDCKILDEENKANYYEFTFLNIQYDPILNETIFSANFDVSRSNIVLDNEGDLGNKPVGFLFSDQLFKDSTYNFNIEMNATQQNYYTQKGKTTYSNGNYLLVRSISKNYFDFNKSWNAHNYNRVIRNSNLEFDISTIFPSVPSSLYTNSSAGIGGIYGYQEIIIPVKKK